MALNQGAGPHKTHLTYEDIDKLWELIYLGRPQKVAHGEDARVIFLGYKTTGKIGAIFKHGGKFYDIKGLAIPTYSGLEIKNIVLTAELEENHDGNHEWDEKENGEKSENKVKKSLHSWSLSGP